MTVSLRGNVTRLAAVAVAMAMTAGLAGCGDVDAGSGGVDRLQAVVEGWDDVVGVYSSASNTLPWMGTAEATVIVGPETPDDRVEEMADALGSFLAEEEGGTTHWSFIDLQLGSFRVTVDDEAAERSQWISALAGLRSDDRVVGGFLGTSDDRIVEADSRASFSDSSRLLGEPSQTVRAIVRDDVPLAEAFGIARTAADGVDALSASSVVAESEDGRSAVSDSEGANGDVRRSSPPTATLGVASAIAAAAPVMDVVATTDTLAVRLERSSDVSAIEAAFRERASALAIELTVDGGVVTSEEGTPPGVVGVAQSLDGREGVVAVDASDAEIVVTLVDAAPVRDTIDTLLAQPDIAAVDTVELRAGADHEGGFSVWGEPDDLDRLGLLVMAGSTQQVLSRLVASAGSTELRVGVDPDEESMTALFAAVRPLVGPGTTLRVEAEREGGFSNDVEFPVADDAVIDLPEGTDAEVADLADLVEKAWAASA